MKNKDYIQREAPRMAERWTNQQKAAFHAYNPNGALARIRKALEALGIDAPPAKYAHADNFEYYSGRVVYMSTRGGYSTPETYGAIIHLVSLADKLEAEAAKC